MHEVYAGVMSHVDAQVGRIVQAIEELGLGDDTVVMVLSDNGASAEGGPHGTLNEYAFTLGSDETVSDMVEQREQLGSNRFYNHYSWGWAWAARAPRWSCVGRAASSRLERYGRSSATRST